MQLAILFDYYGNLLSDKQRQAMQLYYEEDYSLSEIAGMIGISKQGVSDLILRAEAKLRELEGELKLHERTETLRSELSELQERLLIAATDPSVDGAKVRIVEEVQALNAIIGRL